MNDQQATPSDEISAPKWGDSLDDLSGERKQELAQRLWAWKPEMASNERKGPFYYEMLNGLEVFWLAVCTLAGSEGDRAAAEHKLRWAQGDRARSFSLDLSRLSLAGGELVYEAHLENALLNGAHLEEADLCGTHLEGAFLNGAHLETAQLCGTSLEDACLKGAHLENAALGEAHLEGACLREVHLERADLYAAHLEGTDLRGAHLEGACLNEAHLEGADLRGAYMDASTDVRDMTIASVERGCIRVADVHWDGVDLAMLKSKLQPPLGDEQVARAWKPKPLTIEPGQSQPLRTHIQGQRAERVKLFQTAVRANRQLAVVLQDQGMDEEGVRFAYRAQILQRAIQHLHD